MIADTTTTTTMNDPLLDEARTSTTQDNETTDEVVLVEKEKPSVVVIENNSSHSSQKLDSSTAPPPPSVQSDTMKLVVRSPYWGRILKGKTRRDYNGGQSYRIMACQAVLSTSEGQYWGCCPHHGKRVLELKEHHFQDHFSGSWDLYMIGHSVGPTYMVHALFLLPQNQSLIDLAHKIVTQNWSYVGTANASTVRMDLESMLYDTLKQNDVLGYRYHHVHLEVLMDQVFDRETPRSRKAAIEKTRSDRSSPSLPNNSSNNYNPEEVISPVTAKTLTGEGAASSVKTTTPSSVPPIPHVISNDASWFSDTASSVASYNTNSAVGMGVGIGGHAVERAWHREAGPPMRHHYAPRHSAYVTAPWSAMMGPSDPVHTWFPVSMSPTATTMHAAAPHHYHHPLPPPPLAMNQAQQLLQHPGYILGSTPDMLPAPLMPSGYMAPGGGNGTGHCHHSGVGGGTPSSYYYANDTLAAEELEYYQQPPYQPDQAEGALYHQGGHPETADEKRDEDVDTASVSETTAEEDDDDSNSNSNTPERVSALLATV